jgi:hypothetical protein
MTDSMLDRIKEKAQQARSMLSPWLRRSDSQGEDAGGHLQITDRHRQAARKMRVLDDQKLGGAHPQTVLTLNAGLSERMQSIQNMLHFNANISRDNSIWPKVDQVFPSQAAEAPREPEQPGVMKAGTVIQKFSMTPKPGQSIQSFKEQMSRQNQAPAPTTRPKAPVLPAKARLFSRVQEITHREKSLENESGDRSPDPDLSLPSPSLPQKAFDLPEPLKETEPEAVSKPQPEVLKPAPKEPEPVQQKPSAPASQVEPDPLSDALSKPERGNTLPASTTEAASKIDMPVHLPPEAKPPQTAPSDLSEPGDKGQGVIKQARPVSDHAKTVKPDIPLKAAARPSPPVSEKPAPPVSRPLQTVQRQLDNRVEKSIPEPAKQPVVRPPAVSLPLAARQENELPPVQPEAAKPSIAKAVQNEREMQPSTPMPNLPVLRKAVKPVERPEPPASMPADILVQSSASREQDIVTLPVLPRQPASSLNAPTFDASSQTQSEDSMPRSAPTAALIQADQELTSAQPAMPLHTRLLARKSAVQSVKPAVPEMLRAVQSKPLLTPRAGLVSERKYHFESQAKPPAPPTPMVYSASTPSAPSIPSSASVVQRAMEPVQPTQQTEPSAAPLNLLLAAAHSPQAAPVQPARPASVSPQPAPASPNAQSKVGKAAEPNQSEAASGSISQQKSAKQKIGPLKTSRAGIVQRRWDEHSGPDAVARSGSERQEETQQLPIDLDQVASDVLPLVKRLLDIELERLSGGFH